MPRPVFAFFLTLLGMAAVFAAQVLADEPLHVRIDQHVAAQADGPMSRPATDEEWIRRLYLDLAGRIPSAAEAREFLSDSSPDKRARLIDRLLTGPDYPRRMTELFHVMLMERRGDDPEWRKFLHDSFAENKPWDQFVREILNPDAENGKTRGAAFFYTKHLEKYGQNPTDYPGLVRDVGRLFLGMDVQCAQCHDHLFVDDYKQEYFQGMFAFLSNVSIRRGTDFPAVAEKPLTKKLDFMSVFIQEPKQTGPRLPGKEEIAIPTFKRGEEYETPPDRKTNNPGVLKFSPLEVLGKQLPQADYANFTHNAANRLWFVMMGRGIVHPLDLHHSDNPPSHPELLDMLANELVAHKFDIKWMLRELALTETYARASVLPEGVERVPPESFRMALERPLLAEQFLRSMMQATGELDKMLAAGEKADTAVTEEKGESTDGAENAAMEATLDELGERFRKALAAPPKEPEIDFSPTVRGALFVLNDSVVLGWLAPKPGNLVDRLTKIENAEELADELYLSVLTRHPDEQERAEVAEYLADSGDGRAERIGHLVWAMLASTEFCTNH